MFDEQERKIYKYTAHGREVFGDPLALERTLEVHLGGDLDRSLAECSAPEPHVVLAAYENLRRAVCLTFDLGAPFDPATGEGVMEREWLGLLNDFVGWLEKNAGPAADSPTASRPTETSPAGG